MVDKNKAVFCCLLATSAIMVSEKKKRERKMCNKKWYLKRNISYDAHLLNELLETDVPWNDAIVVSEGKLRKLWDSLNELRSTLCERRLERTVLRPALLPVETAQFTQFFRQVWHHTVKLLSLTESVEGTLDMKWHRIAKDFEMSVLRIEVATWKFLCSYNTTFVWQYHGLRLVRKPKHRWENYIKWTLTRWGRVI